MMVHLSALTILAVLGGLVLVIAIWRASVRRARRIATAAKESARLASLTGRVLCAAALFAGVQWVLITHPGHAVLLAVALGLPDLLAGFVLARALTVTTVDGPQRTRGGGRR